MKLLAKQIRSLAGSATIILLVSIVGCSSPPPPVLVASSTSPLVWPDAPDQPRIQYLQSVHKPADIGIKASPILRFGRWLTGSDKGNEALIKPFGIALDEQDNVCLTDTGANAVCYYDRGKKKWYRWEKVGRLRFVSPVAIAKRQGVFFVADSARCAVIAFEENGKLLFAQTNHLERPSGLAILDGQLYVADAQRHCVVVFDLRGTYQSEFGKRGIGPGEFNFPTHLAAGRDGQLYVTDSMNSRVQILDARGGFHGQVGSLGDKAGHFSRPKGVAVDGFGHVYALDALLDSLQIFDVSGRLLLNVGTSGSKPGEFWLPNGIAISRDNEIYTADSYNHRLQVFKYIGPS
jgi:sugar lactone lactonase YvrE